MTYITVICLVLISGHMCCFWVSLFVLFLVLKAIKNQDNEIACISFDKEELLQTWYPLDGYAKSFCYRLQSAVSQMSKFKVWNKIGISFQNRDILWW